MYPPFFRSLLVVCALSRAALAQCTVWDASSNGLDDEVIALHVFDDGSGPALYVGGRFTTAGSVVLNSIGRWNGTSWSALGSGMGASSAGRLVCALADYDDGSGSALYAGGTFSTAGGASAANVAKWNGTSWSALSIGPGFLVRALAVFDAGSGPRLIAAGTTLFPNVARIAQWNGTSWSELGSGLDGAHTGVNALTVHDDSSGPALYVGGTFTSAGDFPANCIARWDSTGWSWDASLNGLNGEVMALHFFDAGSGAVLYAGGAFTTAGGSSASHLARWNGTSWSAVGSGTNGVVTALQDCDDGSGPALYVGGTFTTAGGTSANKIARWDGSSWSALGSGLNDYPFALEAYDDGLDAYPDLIAGGVFTSAGGLPASFLAELHGCGLRSFCFGDGTLATPCPCANAGSAGHGCENSASTGGAVLAASGSARPDTAVLTSSGELSSALSIFLQGDASIPAGLVFGDGVRCTGGGLRRLFNRNAVGGVVSAPNFGAGDPSLTARSAALGDAIVLGTTRVYQVYYRDPSPTFCPHPPGYTWNASSGIRIAW